MAWIVIATIPFPCEIIAHLVAVLVSLKLPTCFRAWIKPWWRRFFATVFVCLVFLGLLSETLLSLLILFLKVARLLREIDVITNKTHSSGNSNDEAVA